MNSQRLAGCGTALVTPFTASGEIDERSLRSFVDWQISSGVHFVVPCGSTGEAATMTVAEHRRVVEITVEQTAGRVPVVAGAASNDTKKAIARSRQMVAAGGIQLLHASPMYNKAPQRATAGDFAAARELHHQLAEWTAAAFVEPNPIPVKAALAMMGKMSNVLRLPLVPLAEKFETTVRAALVSVGALAA